ncbi:hypothetical protein [Klenkia taihuensis]|uniref:Carbamoylphosphate synthase large subunit n=1 Tax=Klenkia taihuensis TaxID=1225127 RepID=A0A1I1PER7_9ACTN|nr:hypothetical protein [Klenkia taihuensis]GHE11472.1 hypothetical protein GCM10011381_24930 [Klenkia taihuensis]SFD04480.1 Carbamoylphosphate synthase large subunit [Klenkia taihuensis]
MLAGLALTLPVDLAVTAAALLTTRAPRPAPAADRRTVLISGGKMTKALQLARSFSAAGHRVVLVEKAAYRFTGHRFSRAVDTFHVVPDPRDPGYAQALLDVVRAEGVDLYVPVCSPVASEPDAASAELLAGHCEVLSLDADTVRTLDDKHAFTALAASLGLSVPDTHRITDAQQVLDFDFTRSTRPYVLKSIAYDPVHRLDLTPLPRPTRAETAAFVAGKPISPDNPWILQEFVTGTEVCTHSTVRDGEVTVWCCCPSSAFQVNYAQVDRPRIREWATRFAAALGGTGQVSLDFIEAEDGTPYAIECNPRTHSAITMFHDHPGLADAYLHARDTPLEPRPGSRPTYWTYHELWRALSAPRTAAGRWRVVREGTDAVFDRADPLPYLVLHHVQVPLLLLRSLRSRGAWSRIDFNIGKLVQPAGD